MPIDKRPLKVFLCHAHADRDAVRALYTRLTNDGVDAWLDKEKLLPGQDWELEIKKAVRAADVVVVCLSKQFNQAGFRQKEVRLALDTAMEKPEGEIFIIPARLEECDNLESLRRWHWVDLFEEDGHERLMRALRRRADNIGATLQIKKSWLPNISSSHQLQKANIKSQINTHELSKVVKTPKQKLTVRKLFGNTILVSWSIFVFVAIVLSWKPFFQTAEPTLNDTPSYIVDFTRTEILEPSFKSESTSTPESTLTTTPLPTEIMNTKGVLMMLVPAGEFIMGSDYKYASDDAKPIRTIFLDSFYMDKYEVTNKLYADCVNLGGCVPPSRDASYTRAKYYGNPEYDDYPVIYVDWYQANAYCEWRGGNLPTEAQWEKSARGTDGRTYPWGEDSNHCYNSNTFPCSNDTTKVGSYKTGKSIYGIYDLMGNVWEWTADWYSENYYLTSPLSNPLGPDTGKARVMRGDSWSDNRDWFRVYDRGKSGPTYNMSNIGFRCVSEVIP